MHLLSPRCMCRPVTEQVDKVSNIKIDGPNGSIPLRIYHPDASRQDLPALMYIHGGCWQAPVHAACWTACLFGVPNVHLPAAGS